MNCDQLSMLDILPMLAECPLSSIHPSVDLYAIFRIEPMHRQSFGICDSSRSQYLAILEMIVKKRDLSKLVNLLLNRTEKYGKWCNVG